MDYEKQLTRDIAHLRQELARKEALLALFRKHEEIRQFVTLAIPPQEES